MAHCWKCYTESHQKPMIIRNPKSGLVLDATDYEVKLQKFNGSDAQKWKLECAKLGRFIIISNKSGRVLDIQGGARKSANLITYTLHGGINQQWYINADGTIQCPEDSLVVDIHGEVYSVGRNIIAFPRHGGDNQIFKFEYP